MAILTYTNDGRYHSSGKSVLFNRDSQGRITSITDPSSHVLNYVYDVEGNTTTYTYDTDGNKLTETDAESNVKTFTYDTNDTLSQTVEVVLQRILAQ